MDKGKTLLLVEDQVIIAMSQKMSLEQYGYRVRTASSGEAALAAVEDDIDLILMDIDLGSGMDGTQAAQKILEDRDIPIVFLSSHVEPEVVEKTEKITSYGYVVKDSGIVVLDASIKMAFKLFEANEKVKCELNERKRFETDLRDSEERFRALHNASFGGITIHDKGLILECNQGLSDITGYTYDELIGMDGLLLISEKTRPLVREKIGAGYEEPYEAMGVRKNGEEYPLRLEARNIPYKGKTVRVVEFRDITESKTYKKSLQKQTEAVLRASNERFRALVEGLPDVIMQFDREGRHLFVSENITQWVDFTPRDFQGKTHRELGFSPDQCREWEEAIRGVFDTGRPYEAEFELKGAKKKVILNWRIVPERDAQGNVVSVLSISRDITDRLMAERVYNTLFREMLDGAALHEILCDDQGHPVNYRFLSVNPAFERMTGLAAEKVVGQKVLDVLPDTEAYWIETYGRVALTGEPVSFEDFSAALDKYFEVTAFRTEPGRFVCIFQDITGRKRDEAALQRQLKEKEILLKEVHHRVKNNILSIESFLQVRSQSVENQEARVVLQEAIARAQSIRVLYDKMLIRKEFREVSVERYTEALVESLLEVFPDRPLIIISREYDDFSLSPEKLVPLGIVINELLTNDFKYAFPDQKTGEISLEIRCRDSLVTLTIRDNGVGMDERKGLNKSEGFGMMIVRMLAEQLGGEFTVKNEGGTVNLLSFPL